MSFPEKLIDMMTHNKFLKNLPFEIFVNILNILISKRTNIVIEYIAIFEYIFISRMQLVDYINISRNFEMLLV